MPEKLAYWLEELSTDHNDIVGKKCANLGEMAKIGLSVPRGFALSVHAYSVFMDETGAADEISKVLAAMNVSHTDIVEGLGSQSLIPWARSLSSSFSDK